MNVLSLFDGISVAQQALKELEIECLYYASEIDKYAITLTQKNFPRTIQLGNVKDIRADMVGQIDLLIGGSPCQDLSIAKNNREGLSGSRSGLFWEYVRILREIKPKYFVLENVASMPKEARDIITRELGVQPIMIDAALVSAQTRKRLFWTNIPHVQQPVDHKIVLRDILESDVDESYTLIKDNKITWKKIGDSNVKVVGTLDEGTWAKRYEQIRRVYGIDGQCPTLPTAQGGGIVPKIVLALTETRTEEAKEIRKQHMLETGKDYSPRRAKELVPRNDEKMNTLTTGITKESLILIVPENTKKGYVEAREGDSVDLSYATSTTRRGRVGEKAKNLMTENHINVFTQGKIRKLTPIECERLQSLPDNYTAGVSNTQRYKALGNAFNCAVIKHILQNMNPNYKPQHKQALIDDFKNRENLNKENRG